MSEPESSNNTEIIYIHGLNATGRAMWPFKFYNGKGHTVTYNTYVATVEEMVNQVDEEISKIIESKETKLILVGWSMGGLISNRLHQKGWNIVMGIYVGSPLNGASIFQIIPTFMPIHPYLKEKSKEEEPPHDYHTISLGWFNSGFDGAVFKDDTVINEENHQHIWFTDHRFGAFDWRILRAVSNKITEVEQRHDREDEKTND